MSNKFVSTLSVINFAALLAFAVFFFLDKEKIVYIDSTKVINSYEGMIAARKDYQGKIAVWRANIDTLTLEVQREIAKYEKESSRMTSREKDLTKQLIHTRQQQLAQYQNAINEKAGQEDAAATKKIIDEINAYIKTYGEEHDFTIVFAATEYGNIAYAQDFLNITQEVIEGLNKKYTGQVPK